MRRQLPDGVNVQRRIDGHVVFGASNDIDRDNIVATRFDPTEISEDPLDVNAGIPSLIASTKVEPIEEKPGFIDSFLGNGVQARIVDGLNGWIKSKARENPGCVERFVCETYRTGESLNGIPYVAMSLTKWVSLRDCYWAPSSILFSTLSALPLVSWSPTCLTSLLTLRKSLMPQGEFTSGSL